MRAWIYNQVAALDLPGGMSDRITSTGGADNPTPPFVLLNMGIEQPVLGMTAESRTQEIPFAVEVHDKPGSMVANVDAAAMIIKNALPLAAPAVVGNMSVLDCRWEDTSNDLHDDHYGTNKRRVSFRLVTRR